ncbi:hypothetical protein SAMN04515671_2290 [Nakamurella panacisegetis]|uniref:Uncharacterized protein n=2 Tax=Nakamurella panacisegetis TaxID=1090615 RepID=A0A1H0NAW8_9ACTN|nr:hypothetical protein SAMN04515671_2290 [Nakamurella panacisegetis]
MSIDGKGSGQLILQSVATGQIVLGGGQIVKRTAVFDLAYTVLVTDYLVAYATLTAARTVTLPTAVSVSGQVYIIIDETGSANTNNITIGTTSSQTINGASTKVINTAYGYYRLYSNGTNWILF